jgi:hypothetical protein
MEAPDEAVAVADIENEQFFGQFEREGEDDGGGGGGEEEGGREVVNNRSRKRTYSQVAGPEQIVEDEKSAHTRRINRIEEKKEEYRNNAIALLNEPADGVPPSIETTGFDSDVWKFDQYSGGGGGGERLNNNDDDDDDDDEEFCFLCNYKPDNQWIRKLIDIANDEYGQLSDKKWAKYIQTFYNKEIRPTTPDQPEWTKRMIAKHFLVHAPSDKIAKEMRKRTLYNCLNLIAANICEVNVLTKKKTLHIPNARLYLQVENRLKSYVK